MAIEIRKGTAKDCDSFVRFLREIREGMDHKEWFYLDPPEVVREYLEGGVMELWLAMDGDRIAAIFDYLVPGLANYNYGYELGLSREELLQVINMDNAAVHPDYRGQGLQANMLAIAEDHIGREEKRILLCTVHPENRFSLNNVLKQGYAVQRKLEMYGSVRYLLRKDIL